VSTVLLFFRRLGLQMAENAAADSCLQVVILPDFFFREFGETHGVCICREMWFSNT